VTEQFEMLGEIEARISSEDFNRKRKDNFMAKEEDDRRTHSRLSKMTGTRTKEVRGVGLQPSQPFNPYKMFTGVFVPEALARCASISVGAKLAWGRLARYAGADGRCYPTMETLGEEIGVGERQAQNYAAELERNQLIRRVTRFQERRQTSNGFQFLWHTMFEDGVNDRSGEGVNNRSGEGAKDRSPKESQVKESQVKESQLEESQLEESQVKESQLEESHNRDLARSSTSNRRAGEFGIP
jgi:hypothetical protein